ncbi:MAG: hypothetical protein IJE97_15505, partial [Thermoguttaceae bacterium]|nr:hypothetical protein [Thermoguttaceae bacterium]
AVALDPTTLALTIEPVANAAGYVYLMSTDPTFDGAEPVASGSGTIALTGLTPGATYYFKAMSKADANGAYAASDWSEPTSATLPVVLNAPAIAFGAVDAWTINFTVNPVDHATSYVYRYSTDSSFANATEVSVAELGAFNIADLQPGETYYFQAAAIGDGVRYLDSSWSETFSTSTPKVDLLAPPVSIQTVGSTTLSFSFESVANASSYEYRYATTQDDLETAIAISASAAGTFELTGLSPATTYYVQVRAIGNGTNYVTSEWSTAVDATTVKIVLDAPEVDATTVDSSTITFEIKEVANADYYEYEYSTSRYFTAETTVSGTTTSAGAFDVDGLSPFTTYYFRAKAVVDAASSKAETHESSAWSTEASATTAKAALPAPKISAVALDPTTLALTIEPVANAAGYVYLMSTDPTFADAEEISRGSGTIALTGLTPGATYYFKAVTKAAENDAYVDSDWSEPTSATLPVVLNAPAISAQATSHTTVALTVGAVDNASSYVVEYSSTPDFATVEGDFALTAADFADGVARLSAVELTGYTMYYFRAKAVGTGVYLDSDFAATEKRTWENPSTFVTIESDVVDPTDNLYSLREAVEVYAQAGDYVSFERGITTVKLDKGHLTIDKPLTIDGSAAMPEDGVGGVTIDAQGLSRVVYVPKYTIYNDYVNFNFLTFTGGNAVKTEANAGEHDPAYGGGLYLGANATFSYCVIADNVAQAAGGGVFVDVRLDAELVTQETPTYFVGVKFVGNEAGTLGGGLYVSSTGDVTVQDGAISENKAKYGAGLLANGKTSVSSTAIFGNEASVQGGGVFVDKSGTLDASSVKIEGNAASQVGGGVYVNGVATFNNASVSENDAVTGAGVAVSVRGNATLSGGELTGNVATDFGGALRVSGTATVKNVGI